MTITIRQDNGEQFVLMSASKYTLGMETKQKLQVAVMGLIVETIREIQVFKRIAEDDERWTKFR